MEKNISRRSFLKGAAVGAAGLTMAGVGLKAANAKAEEAIASLSELILKIQATGDRAAADEFVAKYAVIPSTLKSDIVNLELEKIPVDIRLTYER